MSLGRSMLMFHKILISSTHSFTLITNILKAKPVRPLPHKPITGLSHFTPNASRHISDTKISSDKTLNTRST